MVRRAIAPFRIGFKMRQIEKDVNYRVLSLRKMRLLSVSVFVLCLFAPSGLEAPLQAQAPRKAAAPARAERKVPYAVGERLAYDVSWSSYMTAGTLVLDVQAKKPSFNSTAYYVVAEAQTSGLLAKLYTLYYKADTLIDAYSMLPQRGSVFSKEGSRQRMKVTTFDHGKKQGRFEMQTASRMVKDLGLGTATQDLLSAIYALRTIAPKAGEKFSMPVSDSGWLYQVTWTVGQVEPVKMASGQTVQALRVTPRATDEKGQTVGAGSVLWLSTDGAFKPVRLEASAPVGRIVLALK